MGAGTGTGTGTGTKGYKSRCMGPTNGFVGLMCANLIAEVHPTNQRITKQITIGVHFAPGYVFVYLLIPELHALPFQHGHRSLIRELSRKVDSRRRRSRPLP
jgi:hypothetical protein